MNKIGLVVIGRNEGLRLRQCLNSALGKVANIVYVDSNSTDGSVEMARSLSVDVVELDLSIPFTAARARNEGFTRLLQVNPQIQYIQFVDGDCEIREGWLERAVEEMETKPEVAAVGGRLRERFPEQSIYNQLMDIEWDTPVGEAKYSGGVSMMRVVALKQVGGFNPTLIAGEEPELCVRLRQKGWKIYRIDAEMGLHDAAMTKFNQWWKRNIRGGHAYAEGAWLHGKSPEKHWVKESRSIWLWGLIVPVLALIMAFPTHGWSLLLFTAYPLITYRVFSSLKQQGRSSKEAFFYALSCVVGKVPQVQGQLKFHLSRLLGQKSKLIEYKTVEVE